MAITRDDFWIDRRGNLIHKDNIKAIDKIKDEMVEKLVKEAKRARDIVIGIKNEAYEDVEGYFELLLQDYGIDESEKRKKGNITLVNFSGTQKVSVANQDQIVLSEKIEVAKIKIHNYLQRVTKNASADIQTLIKGAFDTDSKGKLNIKKILELRRLEIDDDEWREGIAIIDDAIEVYGSKSYIRFYERKCVDDKWTQIPLNVGS